MNGEPGAAVLSIFDQLIERVKQRTALRSDGKPIATRVYSQLVLGMPIWRDDYFRPWSPAGGSSLRQTFPSGGQSTEPAAGGAGAGTGTQAQPNPRVLLAMQAAWKTALLCKTMLVVTEDNSYDEYPTGKHLDFAYESVLNGMQPSAPPEMAPDVRARVDQATKLLYVLDADGNIESPTPLYKNYIYNAEALATAKSNFAVQFAAAQRDPAKMDIWPVQSATFQQAVDGARNRLISQGAQRVEQALDVLGSVGVPMQAHMIKKAREAYDAWNLGLSGAVPVNIPYSLILPTNWCDPDDHQGWETLIVDQGEIQHYSSSGSTSSSAQSWQQHAESTGGGGGVMLGFAAFGGSRGSSSTSASFQDSNNYQFHAQFKNTARNLHIEMEFGMCTIVRPWLVSDLFSLRGWYMKGERKNSISDGTVDGQVGRNTPKILPMIPQQFLVVRNVVISADDWGSDGEVMSSYYGTSQGSTSSSSSSTSGGGGVCLGFINFAGRASHSESEARGQSSSFDARSSSAHFGTTFVNNTLRIPGAQIVAFLSDIVPACPDQDDETLK